MRAADRNVLVVDDDERVLGMYKRFFAGEWVVHAASNADDARKLAADHPIDLAIVDLHLEATSSIPLVKQLRAASPALPIAVMSGYLTTDATVAAVQAGANVVVDKPIHPREVLQRLEVGPKPDVNLGETPTLDDAIEAHIARVLVDCGGNVSEAARRLGIYRSSLQRRLRKMALKRKPAS